MKHKIVYQNQFQKVTVVEQVFKERLENSSWEKQKDQATTIIQQTKFVLTTKIGVSVDNPECST